MNKNGATVLVAIAGGTGSGKSWLARRLKTLLDGKAFCLGLDSFYRDQSILRPSHRAKLNYDEPCMIDWDSVEQVLGDVLSRKTVRLPCYDYKSHRRLPSHEELRPKPIVVVEGLWALQHPSIRRFFDLKIFLDCPTDLRLQRRLLRDTAERGRSPEEVRLLFRTVVSPMHRKHVAPQKRWADVILTQPFKGPEVSLVADRLWALIEGNSAFSARMRETFHAELRGLLN